MSGRRLRQKIPSSDDDFDEPPVAKQQAAIDSDEASEPELYDDEEEDAETAPAEEDDDEDEDVDDDDEADFEDNYEEPVPTRPLRGSRPMRESKKRQLSFYEEDDLLESEEDTAPPAKKRVSVKLKIPRRAAVAAAKKTDDFGEPEQPEPEYKPDVSRMTERQRARLADDDPSEKYEELMFARMDEQLLALNRKTQKKKETAEQMAVRKAENARKRADYKVRQLEEEKRDTLNKLLKRRATKTREKEDDDAPESKQTLKPRRPVMGHPALMRWVNRKEGSVLAFAESA